MPVPASMQDLSKTASSNSPAGSEAIGTNLDNYLRATQAILRQTYSTASAPIAAASTVDVAPADGESVEITGSATINSLGTGFVGCIRELRFAGVCAVVHSNNIVLQRGNSITTGAGDVLVFRCIASGQWKQVSNSDAINTTQLNQAIEDALASGGNYDVTPRRWTFAGDGSTADIPIPGADVPDPSFYFVAMEETAGSGLFGVQRPYDDYIVVIGDDPDDSVLRFNVAPLNTALGDIRLLGYARPFLGPPPATTAPWIIYPYSGDDLEVDGTFHNHLIVTDANVPVTITAKANTGDPETDWADGSFVGVLQLGPGQVTLAADGTLTPPDDFYAVSRGFGCVTVLTCHDAAGDEWVASGDLLRDTVEPAKQTFRLIDRSVLIGTNATTGTAKDSFIMPYDFQLDAIADNGCFAGLAVAQAAGSVFTVDVNVNGTSILSTKLTFDNAEKTTLTAATPAVYDAAFVSANYIIAAGAEVTIDIDQVGTALAKGLGVYLRGQRAN